jgi:hypothetical protein
VTGLCPIKRRRPVKEGLPLPLETTMRRRGRERERAI